MIKVKLLPMQFYYCINIKNMYYIGDNAKYLGATIDVELPCLPLLIVNDKARECLNLLLEGKNPFTAKYNND